MKRISRRNFLKVAGVGAAALGLAACGGSKSGSTATSGTASSAAGSSTSSVNTAGFTVQYGPNPETLDPSLNSAIDGSNMALSQARHCDGSAAWSFSRMASAFSSEESRA